MYDRPFAYCGNRACEVILFVSDAHRECPNCGSISELIPSIGDAIPAMYEKQRIMS